MDDLAWMKRRRRPRGDVTSQPDPWQVRGFVSERSPLHSDALPLEGAVSQETGCQVRRLLQSCCVCVFERHSLCLFSGCLDYLEGKEAKEEGDTWLHPAHTLSECQGEKRLWNSVPIKTLITSYKTIPQGREDLGAGDSWDPSRVTHLLLRLVMQIMDSSSHLDLPTWRSSSQRRWKHWKQTTHLQE